MRTSAVLAVTLLTTNGCASLSRARAAEAMQCPEDQLERVREEKPDGELMVAAMLLLPLAALAHTRATLPSAGPSAVRWSGCGLTYKCDRDGCGETAGSRAERLARVVPTLMEKSRQRLGTGAWAERVGYFTWDLTSPKGQTHCHVIMTGSYGCSPDLDAETRLPVVAAGTMPTPPPTPPPVEPLRPPLRAREP
jgi:hypothetical protein